LPEKLTSSHNNGTSSTLTKELASQVKENSTKTSTSMLRDHSSLSLISENTDTLMLSATETWSLRLETAEIPNSGGSINSH
jgi:hypothetical protein